MWLTEIEAIRDGKSSCNLFLINEYIIGVDIRRYKTFLKLPTPN